MFEEVCFMMILFYFSHPKGLSGQVDECESIRVAYKYDCYFYTLTFQSMHEVI